MSDRAGCPSCQGETSSLIWAEGVEYRRCSACHLAFWHPLPTQAQLDALYSGLDYFRSEGDGAADRARHSFFSEAYRQFTRELARERLAVLKRYRTNGRLLDIGCATGLFLEMAAREQYMVEGVEPSEAAAELVRRHYGLKVHAGPLGSARIEPASLDVVTMFHVLEHIADPPGFLAREVRPLLVPGGLLVVEVPNLDSIDFQYAREEWAGLQPGVHVWQFQGLGLSGVLLRAGFRVLEVSTPHGGWTLSKAMRYLGMPERLITGLRRRVALPIQQASPSGAVASVPVDLLRHVATALTLPIGWPFIKWIEHRGRGDRLLAVAENPGPAA